MLIDVKVKLDVEEIRVFARVVMEPAKLCEVGNLLADEATLVAAALLVNEIEVAIMVGIDFEMEVLKSAIEAVETAIFGLPDELILPPFDLMLCQFPI